VFSLCVLVDLFIFIVIGLNPGSAIAHQLSSPCCLSSSLCSSSFKASCCAYFSAERDDLLGA
jgi:hypothetical protein